MQHTASFQDFQRFHKFRRTTQFPLDPYVTSLYHLHSRHQFPIRNYYGHVIEQHRILRNGSRSCKPFNPRRPRLRPLHRSPTHATTPSISQLTPNLHTALPIDLVLPCLSRWYFGSAEKPQRYRFLPRKDPCLNLPSTHVPSPMQLTRPASETKHLIKTKIQNGGSGSSRCINNSDYIDELKVVKKVLVGDEVFTLATV